MIDIPSTLGHASHRQKLAALLILALWLPATSTSAATRPIPLSHLPPPPIAVEQEAVLIKRVPDKSPTWYAAMDHLKRLPESNSKAQLATGTIKLFSFNRGQANAIAVNIELPSGEIAQFLRNDYVETGNYSGWTGISSDRIHTATLVIMSGDQVSGRINWKDRQYQVTPTGAPFVSQIIDTMEDTANIRIDPEKDPTPSPELIQREKDLQEKEKAKKKQSSTSSTTGATSAAAVSSTALIDMMFVTTPNAGY